MGVENERTALSVESIPKSIVEMEQSTDVAVVSSSENPEPPEQLKPPKVGEKNGNLDIYLHCTREPFGSMPVP